jgi:hypothetical protein
MRRLLIATMLAWAGFVAPAAASLLGQGFTLSYRIPDLSSIYDQASWSPASFTVGAGVETVGDVEGVTSITVDVSASALSLVLATTLTNPTWNAAGFNGVVFSAAGPLGIIGATVNAATTMAGFDAGRLSFTGTEIRIDWNGLGYTTGTTVMVDFTFATVPVPVPEPASLALLGAGLLGLGMLRRRGQNARLSPA